jgi:spermidine synthase
LSAKSRLDPMESLSQHSDRDRQTNQQRRPVLACASHFSLAPGTVRVLEPPEGANVQLVEQLCRGEITGTFMLDTSGMRHLHFDLKAVQSSMRLEDPAGLVTAYAQKMMAFLLFNRAPRDILMIGLGGGSLVKFCHRHLQNTRLTVVEIDPDVVALREWFHIPPDDARLQVLLEDGADFVRRGDWAADVLLIDAFDRAGVAPSLASRDFYVHAFRCLRPGGLLVMNLAGERARYVAHLEQLCKACPGPVLLVPVATDGNLLIFAFAQQTQAWTFASLEATAEELQSEFALEFPRFLRRLRTGELL